MVYRTEKRVDLSMAMLNNQMVYCHVQLMLIHFQREGVKNEGLQSGEPISATKSFDLPNIGVTNIHHLYAPFIYIYIYNIYILTISTIDVWGAPILTPMPALPLGHLPSFKGYPSKGFAQAKHTNLLTDRNTKGWRDGKF